ncbi:DNA polymerase Y family protein [Comamonas aquatilis]|uniref:hypothetical protein n=1 Tax=Comamonas aquatilis TaxID=1778406 RepID=UPI0039EFE25D
MTATALPSPHWMAWPLAALQPDKAGGAAPSSSRSPTASPAISAQASTQNSMQPLQASACWWALQHSPRVAVLEEALLMETSSVQRLWGGREPTLHRLAQAFQQAVSQAAEPGAAAVEPPASGEGPTAWQALAQLRLKLGGENGTRAGRGTGQGTTPLDADDFPLWTLTALQQHSAVLQRLGCTRWSHVRALPRTGLSRRIGAKALRVLDEAYGLLPQPLNWLQLPEQFGLRHDLGYPAHHADAVLQAAQPLLRALQAWLQARHRAVLALQLRWHHDLRRVDGQELPLWGELCIRTAQPVHGAQAMAHLQRLLREHLAQQRWRAPVDMLDLNLLESVAWAPDMLSCLPQPGEKEGGQDNSLPWHEWVERISARWGEDAVRMVTPCADHRPEAMQQWQSASSGLQPPKPAARPLAAMSTCWQSLCPPWLLAEPHALPLQGSRPSWHGPLQLRAGPYRLESGWWGEADELAVRDYFVAFNAVVGHVWIYRQRAAETEPGPHAASGWGSSTGAGSGTQWFAQGIYG